MRLSLALFVHPRTLLGGKGMCIRTEIVILLPQPKLNGGFNMAFSKDDIQKAFKTVKNSGLGDFMFQEPFSNRPFTGKNRRVSNTRPRCNCKKCRSSNNHHNRTETSRVWTPFTFRNHRSSNGNRRSNRNRRTDNRRRSS